MDQNNSINNYGYEAISQARQLEKLVETETSVSSRTFIGMVHQPRKDTIRQFALGNQGRQALLSLDAYLASINASTLASMVPAAANNQPSSAQDIKNMKQQSQAAFDTMLARSVALYSPTTNTIKHLVILNAGPGVQIQTPGLADIETIAALQGISISLGNNAVTNYNNSASWFGVDLENITNNNQYAGTMISTGYEDSCDNYYAYYAQTNATCDLSVFAVPAQKSLHFSASVNIEGQTNIYTLANTSSSRLHFALHTINPVDSTIKWQAFDIYGNLLTQYTQTISSLGLPSDSGVAKLVGADLNLIDDVYPPNEIGAAFGVVRYDYSLIAQNSDTIGTAASSAFQSSGLPYLTASEIYSPSTVSLAQQNLLAQLAALLNVRSLQNGRVQFSVQGNLRSLLERAEILDLQGRVIATLDVQTLHNLGTLEWDGSSFAKGMYLVHLTATGSSFSKQFLIQ